MAVQAVVAAAAVVGAGAGIKSANAAGDAADHQKELSAQQQASNTAEAARSRRDNLRKQRIEQAEIEAAGAAQGTAGSSANLAVADNLAASTAASTAATSRQVTNLNNQAAIQSSIADAQSRQQKFNAIGGIASSTFNMAASTQAGQKTLNNVFS